MKKAMTAGDIQAAIENGKTVKLNASQAVFVLERMTIKNIVMSVEGGIVSIEKVKQAALTPFEELFGKTFTK